MKGSCAREEVDVPSLRDNDIVERRVFVAKTCQANPENHLVGGV